MGINDLFTIVSPEERLKREQEYQQKILPLGPEQKDAVLSVLREIINPKIKDTEILFFFIASKQKYVDKKKGTVQEITRYLQKRRIFKDHEIKAMISLILLDCETVSLEVYPTVEDVKRKADEL